MQEAEERVLPQEEIDSWLTRVKSWEQIKARLLSKETLSDIARWLEVTEPEAKRIKLESLIRLLGRIRAKLTESETQAKLAELQRKADEAQGNADGSKKASQYIDVLESLAELFTLQMERIKKGRTIEEKVNYLLTKLTQDIGEAREILRFMFEVQQELGITKRRPLEFQGKLAVLTFDQRQLVNRMLDLVKQKALSKQIESKLVQEAAEEVVEDQVLADAVKDPNSNVFAEIEGVQVPKIVGVEINGKMVDKKDVRLVDASNGTVIDVEPTDDRMTRSFGKPIPIADKFTDSEDGGKTDLPWEE